MFLYCITSTLFHFYFLKIINKYFECSNKFQIIIITVIEPGGNNKP